MDSTHILRLHAQAALAFLLWPANHAAACWEDAATRYQVNSAVLVAIAKTESGLNPLAMNRNRNGSRDIGLMQINSAWLPALEAHGIREHDLFDACTSIHVGAWVLAQNIHRLGYTWDAVGAYNATSPSLRKAYVDKVKKHLVIQPAVPRSTP